MAGRPVPYKTARYAGCVFPIWRLLNRKPAIYVGDIIALAMNLLMVNGILLRRMDLLKLPASSNSCKRQTNPTL